MRRRESLPRVECQRLLQLSATDITFQRPRIAALRGGSNGGGALGAPAPRRLVALNAWANEATEVSA